MNARFFLLPALLALTFGASVVLNGASSHAQESAESEHVPQAVIAFIDENGRYLSADVELRPDDTLRVQVALIGVPPDTQATAYLSWAKLLSDRVPIAIQGFAPDQLPVYSNGQQTPQIVRLTVPYAAANPVAFVVVVYDADGPGDTADPIELTAGVPVRVGPASDEVDLPPTRDVVTARILARRHSDGQLEVALQPEGHHRILPRFRFLPNDSAIGRWSDSSEIELEGKALGRISARPLIDGRVELSFVHAADGNRILPAKRKFPAVGGATGWMSSNLFEVAESEAPPAPPESTEPEAPPPPLEPLVTIVVEQEQLEGCYGETITVSARILRDEETAPDGTEVTFSPHSGDSIAPNEPRSRPTVEGYAAIDFDIVGAGETIVSVVSEGEQSEVTVTGAVTLDCEHVRQGIANLYAPDLRFSSSSGEGDSGNIELFHPVSVDVFLEHSALYYNDNCQIGPPVELGLLSETTQFICGAEDRPLVVPSEATVLSLKHGTRGETVNGKQKWDTYEDWWAERVEGKGENVIYARVDRAGEEQIVIQYWFFYVYQPGEDVVGGSHEGDWEAIFIVFDPEDDAYDVLEGAIPVLLGLAEHKGGQRYETCQVDENAYRIDEGIGGQEGRGELRADWSAVPDESSRLRPVVYVAYETHASYGWKGEHKRSVVLERSVKEQHYGDGYWRNGSGTDVERVILLANQPWLEWRGKWGSSDPLFSLGGTSPRGPKHPDRGSVWSSPMKAIEQWQLASDKWPDHEDRHCVWASIRPGPAVGNTIVSGGPIQTEAAAPDESE